MSSRLLSDIVMVSWKSLIPATFSIQLAFSKATQNFGFWTHTPHAWHQVTGTGTKSLVPVPEHRFRIQENYNQVFVVPSVPRLITTFGSRQILPECKYSPKCAIFPIWWCGKRVSRNYLNQGPGQEGVYVMAFQFLSYQSWKLT